MKKGAKGPLASTTEVKRVSDRVGRVEDDITALQTMANDVDRVANEVGEMHERVDGVDRNVGKVRIQVAALEEKITKKHRQVEGDRESEGTGCSI